MLEEIQNEAILWQKLPTVLDYIDVDLLYDNEEIENYLYEATKNLGW
jgi:hypothetical protein